MGRQKRAYQSVTIRDVAERAGVAVSTVSRVLNGLDRVSEETRRRVEQAARELSYVPNNFAASMVTGQSKILGIIVPSFTHDFFGFIAQTAEHVFRKHGYLTIVSASGEDPVARPRRLPAALLPHARRRAPRADGRAPEGPRVL